MPTIGRSGPPLLCVCLAACAAGPGIPQAGAPPRVSATQSIVFDGATFTQLFVTRQDGDILREYYLPGETPDKWTRFIELRVYSGTAEGTSTADFVKDMERRLKQRDSRAQSAMSLNPDGSASYDFATRSGDDALAGASEFDAFKFSTDPRTHALVAFHYAERFPGDTQDRDDKDAAQRLLQIEARIRPEIAAVPAYQE